MKKVVLLFNIDPKQDTSAPVSHSAKIVNHNNNGDDDDVSNTKQSSSLVYTRNNINSNINRIFNSNNKNVKVIDARIKEIDQSNQKVDNNIGQGIVGKSKEKTVLY